jgi:hypothetical protein
LPRFMSIPYHRSRPEVYQMKYDWFVRCSIAEY